VGCVRMSSDERVRLLGHGGMAESASFVDNSEYIHAIASRVLYSRTCGAFYVSLLVASITEVVWILHPWLWSKPAGQYPRIRYPRSRLFFAVETYLTVGLAGETTLRMLWQRARFWGQCGNVFDAVVSALSVLSFVLYVDRVAQSLEVVVLLVMVSWIGLRLARLLAVARSLHARQRSASQNLDVDFASSDLAADLPSPLHSPRYDEESAPPLHLPSHAAAALSAAPPYDDAYSDAPHHHHQHSGKLAASPAPPRFPPPGHPQLSGGYASGYAGGGYTGGGYGRMYASADSTYARSSSVYLDDLPT